ncbi:MAG: hypothetical protein KI792_01315 [Alphaproteobacteria bacterium]|nr:hypothetical protein [Alphaproteobacteria bacterium SS10]
MNLRRTRFRHTIAALAITLMALPGLAHALDYVEGFDALPLMPGLAPSAAGSLIFDKPDGRILEAVLIGQVSASDTFSYYEPTLRSLGWEAVDESGAERHYRRGVENLQLLYQEGAGTAPAQLILRLNPAPAN